MYWRVPRKQFEAQKGAGNRRALRKLVREGPPPGLLAYAGREPVGWCAIARREEFPVLDRSRVLARVDDAPVWSLACLYIARGWRRRGVSQALLRGAVEFARRRGARLVEGYPIDPKKKNMPDVFAWTGLVSGFTRAGFREVARRSPTRPIVRIACKG